MINFKEERAKRGLSIEDVSSSLRIRKQYIIAIEEGNFEAIPSETYVNGYIRSYCEYLKIPVPEFKQQEKVPDKIAIIEPKFSNYIIAGISLLLLLIGIILYHKYYEDDLNHNKKLIYVDESN